MKLYMCVDGVQEGEKRSLGSTTAAAEWAE